MKKEYIYIHLHADNKPAYVGIGTSNRCYITTGRSKRHKKFMDMQLPNLKVKFLHLGADRPFLEKVEKEYINMWKPCFNRNFNSNYKHDNGLTGKPSPLRILSDNDILNIRENKNNLSQLKLGKLYNISQGHISRIQQGVIYNGKTNI